LIDDPLFGPGPTFPLVPILIGVVGVLAISIAGAFALQRNPIPAKRGFLIRFHVYMGVTFLLFFALPGLLAGLGVIADPMLGLATAADLFFFFFLLRWSQTELEKFREAEKARVGAA